MDNQRNVSIVKDVDGSNIVIINDIRFRGKTWDEWDEIEKYLKQYVGECYEILETSDRVFIGDDFPSEYAGSEYTTHLWKGKKHAKANASQGIPELIMIADSPSIKNNVKEKHLSDAKYGWYCYRTRFALPVYKKSSDQSLSEYKLYSADLLIRHDEDGKKYLYDLINIDRLDK